MWRQSASPLVALADNTHSTHLILHTLHWLSHWYCHWHWRRRIDTLENAIIKRNCGFLKTWDRVSRTPSAAPGLSAGEQSHARTKGGWLLIIRLHWQNCDNDRKTGFKSASWYLAKIVCGSSAVPRYSKPTRAQIKARFRPVKGQGAEKTRRATAPSGSRPVGRAWRCDSTYSQTQHIFSFFFISLGKY